MKYYLIVLILIIMAAGGHAMFNIAYNGLTQEGSFGPNNETAFLIGLAIWFILMMVAAVLLLNYRNIKGLLVFVGLLTVGVLAPVVYMFLKH